MATQPGHLVSANGSGMAESIIAKLSFSVGLVPPQEAQSHCSSNEARKQKRHDYF